MNCDAAFDQLTAPNGRTDPALAQHLASCPRCRQMRDTLSPAFALFDATDFDSPSATDARPEASGSSRPAHSLLLTPESVEVAERCARSLATRSRLRRCGVDPRTLRMAGAAALVMFGAMCGMWGSAPGSEPRSPLPRVTPAQHLAACTRTAVGNIDYAAPAVDPKSIVMSCVACHLVSR